MGDCWRRGAWLWGLVLGALGKGSGRGSGPCSQRHFFTLSGKHSAENSGAVLQQGPVLWALCVRQVDGEPMRGSSLELTAAKSVSSCRHHKWASARALHRRGGRAGCLQRQNVLRASGGSGAASVGDVQ